MSSNRNEQLWSAKELMRFLSLGKTAFYTAKRAGKLPPVCRIGNNIWRWNPDTVRRWISQNETEASVDLVLSERASKAVDARTKNKKKDKLSSAQGKVGRPTKLMQVAKRNMEEGS